MKKLEATKILKLITINVKSFVFFKSQINKKASLINLSQGSIIFLIGIFINTHILQRFVLLHTFHILLNANEGGGFKFLDVGGK